MNIYEIGSMAEKLSTNTYPGRGIVLGQTSDGKKSVAAYFIMGRSVNSRNRVFIEEADGIRTEAYDPSLLADPSLIIYHPVREVARALVVTNGDQTDTIRDHLELGQTFESACARHYFTYPPIAGLGHFLHTYVCDGNPIPTFQGEPERVAIPDD
ncbi:MAG: inosine monophosphate cyclohydrolase, partial [Oscillospiraceae bacterium]|nr:inosine monophosphate cyclohydrolase [Oscillospiraceae bacterium]